MATLSNSVIDAALSYISTNCNKAQVRASGSSILVNSITLDASNYGAAGDNSGSGGGRKMECLSSSASDMQRLTVNSAGSAAKVALLASSTVHVVASIASAPVNLGASDSVNLSTFSVIIKDPS